MEQREGIQLEKNQNTVFQSSIWATVVIILIIGFIFLTHALHIEGYWSGILFLWYFGSQKTDTKKIVEIVMGGLVGLGIALALTKLPVEGTMNLVLTLLIFVTTITLLISEKYPLIFNQATALTLTIFTMYELATPAQINNGIIGFIVGAIYFGSATIIINRITGSSDAPAAQVD